MKEDARIEYDQELMKKRAELLSRNFMTVNGKDYTGRMMLEVLQETCNMPSKSLFGQAYKTLTGKPLLKNKVTDHFLAETVGEEHRYTFIHAYRELAEAGLVDYRLRGLFDMYREFRLTPDGERLLEGNQYNGQNAPAAPAPEGVTDLTGTSEVDSSLHTPGD